MKKKKLLRAILLILIVCTIAFIWGNSLLGKEASGQQSGWVREFLQNVADLLGLRVTVDEYVVRKLAHFLEFFLLGLEVAWFGVCKHKPDRRDLVDMFAAVFTVAFLDETWQIFSGRGPAIADMWLDISGGIAAMLLFFALYYLASCKKTRSR